MEAHRNAPRIGDAVYDAMMSMDSTDIAVMQDPTRLRMKFGRIRESH